MPITQTDPPAIRHNIVLFGETGGGKSSIINMLIGSEVAPISSAAFGCTLDFAPYTGAIDDQLYMFWDTAGLNETDIGKIPDLKAVGNLYHLLQKLQGGVSLLVFCMRKPKNTWRAAQQNWDLFKNIICQDKVPVVIAVTHLDQDNRNTWWPENLSVFAEYNIFPSQTRHREYKEPAPATDSDDEDGPVTGDPGAACITATKGKYRKGGYKLQEEYDESCWKIRKLIYESHLSSPWKVERVQWFQEVVQQATSSWMCPLRKPALEYLKVPGRGIFSLVERWRLANEEEAKKIVEVLEKACSDSQ